MNPRHPEYKKFKKEFWEWFDSQPIEKKRMFWNFKEDMAETNFYFTVWQHKRN